MEWVRSFFEVAALLGVGAALAPVSPKIRKATLFVFSVIFLSMLLSGARAEGLLDLLRLDFSEPEEVLPDGDWGEAYREGVEQGILLDLCGRFGLNKEEVKVSAVLLYGKETVSISSLKVFLSGASVTKDIPGLVRYAESVYETECEVVIGEE